ncbi:Glycosyltransferase 25 family member [Operophtera brumata]|uniref:Glycosyltransferase 25 family member n=1 Tax=Operophtera brumata TaxID=104452 RepID=A0A0L7LDU7_OPEBR|nr:Glycosyltransferase 25 family member [Operophtera brumata]
MECSESSRKMYFMMLDADVFLTDPGTLKSLVKKDRHVVAPMLLTDGLYSNFWAGMTEDYYYRRTDNYEEIIRRKEIGCFDVPMVHSAVLISLRQGINLTVCNDEIYGFVPIPVEDELNTEADQVDNVRLEALGRGIDLPVDPLMMKFMTFPNKTKYGLDEVYLINLERRTERKNLMMKSFDTLGDHITKPLYSYWTLGYLISENGARKLIKAEPLAKMLPVDEFLPIMYSHEL